MTRFRSSSLAWIVLAAVPALLVALGLWPGLGTYGQGYLPEILAPERTAGGDFEELARLVRLWLAAALGLCLVVGFIFWLTLKSRWRSLLRTFDAPQLLGFRGLVWRGRVVGSLLCGALLGVGLMALAPPLRGLSAAAWVVTIALCAAASLLQYLATVFAVDTRRLYRGR